MSEEAVAGLMAVLGVFAVIGIIMLVVGILTYVLEGIGFSAMAKNRGYDKPWLAWIPVASVYLMGAIADDINMRNGKETNLRKWLLGLAIGGIGLSIVIGGVEGVASALSDEGEAALAISAIGNMISSMLSMAMMVFTYIALYKIYNEYSPNSSTIMLICTIVFCNIVRPFMIFAIRNNPPASVMAAPTPAYNPYGAAPAYPAPAQPEYPAYPAPQNNGYPMPQQSAPQNTIPAPTAPEQSAIPTQTNPAEPNNIPQQINNDTQQGYFDPYNNNNNQQ